MRSRLGKTRQLKGDWRPSGAAYGAGSGVFGDQEGRADQQGRENGSTGLNWGVFLGAFAGSLIELVEILAVVLVVGSVAGWRNALAGAGSAVGLVVVVALIVGKGLALIPVHALEFFAGIILLAFGQMWARSVIKYYGGILQPKDDEDERLRDQLRRGGSSGLEPRRPGCGLQELPAGKRGDSDRGGRLRSRRGRLVRVDRWCPYGFDRPHHIRDLAPGTLGAGAGQGDEVRSLHAPFGLRHLLAWRGPGVRVADRELVPPLAAVAVGAPNGRGDRVPAFEASEAAGTPKPPTRGGSKPPGGRP